MEDKNIFEKWEKGLEIIENRNIDYFKNSENTLNKCVSIQFSPDVRIGFLNDLPEHIKEQVLDFVHELFPDKQI